MRLKIFALALLIFVTAFSPRLYALEKEGVNPDERTWHSRVDSFIFALREKHFLDTQVSAHPGTTLLWLSGVAKSLAGFESQKFPYNSETFPQVHRAMVFPIVLANSLAAAGVYLLLRKLTSGMIAFVAGLLVALDPFFIAHSRVVQMDGLLASLMVISVLSLLVHQKTQLKRCLILSALIGGLAILTKFSALFLIPFLLLVLGINFVFRRRLWLSVEDLVLWGVICLLTITVFYPAFWEDPILAARNLKLFFMQGAVEGALLSVHPRDTFFLGKVTSNEGWFFYPLVLALRSTPITFVFGIVGGIWGIRKFLKKRDTVPLFVILYSLFFLIQMTIGAKKGDRYLLPAVLGLDILAAYGLARVIDLIIRLKKYQILFTFLLFAVCFFILAPLNSHYLAYYNPLFGGAKTARKTIVVGWGEGFYEVAQHLNQKPNAEKLKVLSFFESSLTPLFKGKVFKFGRVEDSKVDYLVFYVSQVQRGIDAEVVEKYFSSQKPEYVVKLNGVEYAWIFKAKKDV